MWMEIELSTTQTYLQSYNGLLQNQIKAKASLNGPVKVQDNEIKNFCEIGKLLFSKAPDPIWPNLSCFIKKSWENILVLICYTFFQICTQKTAEVAATNISFTKTQQSSIQFQSAFFRFILKTSFKILYLINHISLLSTT